MEFQMPHDDRVDDSETSMPDSDLSSVWQPVASGYASSPPPANDPPVPLAAPAIQATRHNIADEPVLLFESDGSVADEAVTEADETQTDSDAHALSTDIPVGHPFSSDLEPHWTRPAAADDVSVREGIYRGRSQVGEVGAMLRVAPSVRSKLVGAFIPDSIVDSGIISDSVSIGVVSVKGANHHLSETPRQDAYAIAADTSWVVIAIADGVSEGKLSHVAAAEAARVAVSESLRALAASTPDHVSWADVGTKARDAIRALGRRRAQQQVGPADTAPEISDRTIARIMSTTCDLLVVPTVREHGSLRVWRVRFSGDGSFYVIDPARGWGLLHSGKDAASSMIDNAVDDPLPLGGGNPQVASWDLRPGQAIVLCTDGFGDVIGEGARPVGRYLFEAWQQPLDTTQLLFTSSFVNTNADDDRTAAIVWATA